MYMETTVGILQRFFRTRARCRVCGYDFPVLVPLTLRILTTTKSPESGAHSFGGSFVLLDQDKLLSGGGRVGYGGQGYTLRRAK